MQLLYLWTMKVLWGPSSPMQMLREEEERNKGSPGHWQGAGHNNQISAGEQRQVPMAQAQPTTATEHLGVCEAKGTVPVRLYVLSAWYWGGLAERSTWSYLGQRALASGGLPVDGCART